MLRDAGGAATDAPRGEATGDALIVGNPTMPWVTMCGSRAFRPSPLRGADSSSRAVARLLGTSALSGPSATERAVMSLLPTATVVSLETHGYAFETEARSRETFIALAPRDSVDQALPSEDDGRLTVGEIMDRVPRMTADLVVLSACQTAMGDLKDAEGTIGLQRAFLSKGARSVLVSLWNVNDQATARLIEEFYTRWRATPGVSKAEALRLAQKRVSRRSIRGRTIGRRSSWRADADSPVTAVVHAPCGAT